MGRTAFRTCPLCEATCGLELTLEGFLLRRQALDLLNHVALGAANGRCNPLQVCGCFLKPP